MDEEQDLAELLDAIVWGLRIVEVPSTTEDTEETYVLRPLSLEERNMGNYFYKKSKADQERHGILNREQRKRSAIKNGLWKVEYDKDIDTLREELKKTNDDYDLENTTKMLDSKGRPKRQSPTAKLKKLDKKRAKISKTLSNLELEHAQHIEIPSAEHYAEYERGLYFLQCVTMSFPDMKQVWPKFKSLQDEHDTVLVAHLMNAFYSESITIEKHIRSLARSGYWRSKWLGSKKNRGVKTLFDREMYDLTIDQFRLVYWSQIYDSAFESMEPPSDEVLENDVLFDRWLEDQHKARKQERKKSAFDKKVSSHTDNANEVALDVNGEYSEECWCGVKEQAEALGNEKLGTLHDPSCPYGVYIYYNEEKRSARVEEVQSANPANIRKRLGAEQKHLSDLGEDGMEEQFLRGDKARSAFGLNTKLHGAGEYGKEQRGRGRPQ